MQHVINRSLERYNQEFIKQDFDCIKTMILQGNSIPMPELETKSKKRCFHYVRYKKIPLKVLYAKARYGYESKILTVYPLDVDEYNAKLNEQKAQQLNKAIKLLKHYNYVIYKNWRNK